MIFHVIGIDDIEELTARVMHLSQQKTGGAFEKKIDLIGRSI